MKKEPYELESGAPQDSTRQYMHEIGRHPLLTPEEERETAITFIEGRSAAHELETLLEAEPDADPEREDIAMLEHIKKLGEEARHTMIVSNLRLVVSIAKRYQGNGLELIELIQEGNIGLERAVDKFDPYKGFKFSTYATWWIKQGITRAYQNTGDNIRVPNHMHLEMNRLKEAERALTSSNTSASDQQLADYLGWEIAKVTAVRSYINLQKIDSLNAKIGEHDGHELEDVTVDVLAPTVGELALSAVLKIEVDRAMAQAGLNDREKYILEMRFGIVGDGESKTLQEIGDSLRPPLTRERVRQLEQQALAKLRKVPGLRDMLLDAG
jgi:RNA polymerase primary sigma factor